jgi:RND family efflux transporter MFP subunit
LEADIQKRVARLDQRGHDERLKEGRLRMLTIMTKRIYITTLILIILVFAPRSLSTAENKQKKKMPPANVVVSRVTTGTIAPEGEFIGTVYYLEVSDVSAEVNGTVKIIKFEEGQRVKRGKVLVKLDSDLLQKNLQASVASHEQILSDLERARKDLARMESLYKKKIIAERDYDDRMFQVKSLEKKSAALKAEVERLEIELKKKVIRAPFNGVIIKRHVARGEWLSPGDTVATVARDDAVDIIVEVPEEVIRYLKPGMAAKATAAGKEKDGRIVAIIPKGDILTRTFPVKVRIKNPTSLLEGMEARVRLPTAQKIDALFVPRDAVLNMSGKTVIVAVVDSKAVIIPTKVVGYQGMKAGINAEKTSEGMKVVVKGNERLRDGQSVTIIEEVE